MNYLSLKKKSYVIDFLLSSIFSLGVLQILLISISLIISQYLRIAYCSKIKLKRGITQ